MALETLRLKILRSDCEQLNSNCVNWSPPSLPQILAPGSSAGARRACRCFSTCGINGQPPRQTRVPSHLFLGIFIWRSRARSWRRSIGTYVLIAHIDNFFIGASVRQSNSNRSKQKKPTNRKQYERPTDNKTEQSRRALKTIF
jgi:hypothetical protein